MLVGLTLPVDKLHVHFGAGRLGFGLVLPALESSGSPYVIVNRPSAVWEPVVEREKATQQHVGVKVSLGNPANPSRRYGCQEIYSRSYLFFILKMVRGGGFAARLLTRCRAARVWFFCAGVRRTLLYSVEHPLYHVWSGAGAGASFAPPPPSCARPACQQNIFWHANCTL